MAEDTGSVGRTCRDKAQKTWLKSKLWPVFHVAAVVYLAWLWPVLRIVIPVYLVWCLLLFFFQDTMLFPRYVTPDVTGQKPSDSSVVQVWITSEEGKRVEGWYLPSLLPGDGQKRPAVVFFHGNGELIDFWYDEFNRYRKWGFGVLLPEYRGYGRSGGSPSQAAIAADMRGFYEWLLTRPEVDPKRIIYHGRSLGGGVACELAQDHPPAALILQSTFKSAASMAARYMAPPFLVRHPFRSDKVIPHLTCPIFIAHGKHDEIIPVSHAQKLRVLARQCVYYEVNSGHNDFPMDDAFWRNVEEFLRQSGMLKDGSEH